MLRLDTRGLRTLGAIALGAMALGAVASRLFPRVPEQPPVGGRCVRSAFWLEHGWLAPEAWFAKETERNRAPRFRSAEALSAIAVRLRDAGTEEVYPHIGPITASGEIPKPDADRVHALSRALAPIALIPWVGGVLGKQAFPERPEWRARFIESAVRLLGDFPEFAGIHLNIEPWPPDDPALYELLSGLRARWPRNKILSLDVPAVSSPLGLGWSCALPERDLAQLAGSVDEIVVSLYNTGAVTSQSYVRTVERCALRALLNSHGRRVWLGLAAFPDEKPYHDASIEDLTQGLRGALSAVAQADTQSAPAPSLFAGVAVYAEWSAPRATFSDLGMWGRTCK